MGEVKMSAPAQRMLLRAHERSLPGDGLRISGMGQHATARACERRGWLRVVAWGATAVDTKARVHITDDGRRALREVGCLAPVSDQREERADGEVAS